MQLPQTPLSINPLQASAHTPSATIHMSDNNHEIFIKLIDSNKIPFVPEHPYNVSTLSSGTHGSGNSLNDGKVKEATILKKDITEKKDKNDNFNIAPEGMPSSISIIPTILIILTAFTVLFLLYKVKLNDFTKINISLVMYSYYYIFHKEINLYYIYIHLHLYISTHTLDYCLDEEEKKEKKRIYAKCS